jgi:hypothetical protein
MAEDSSFLVTIQQLVSNGEVRISEHGYDELAADDLFASELVDGVANASLLEDYPDFPKGPRALLLQSTQDGALVHAVWGIPAGHDSPAVLTTAYRPDPEKWNDGFTRRNK